MDSEEVARERRSAQAAVQPRDTVEKSDSRARRVGGHIDIVDNAVIARRLGAIAAPCPRVVVSGNCATPWELVRVLDGACGRYRLVVLNAQHALPSRDGVVVETPFHGPGTRSAANVEYLPMRLSLLPTMLSTIRPPDVVLVHTSTPRDGRVSLGIEVDILPAAIDAVRRRGGLVIAQLNRHMPYTFGDGEVDVADVDLGLEVDGPIPTGDFWAADDVADAIGARAARAATDGCTIQVGIGRTPDAVLDQLTRRRDIGVWSELISDGVMRLERAGALDTTRPITTTFLVGSTELYDWADANPRLALRRTEHVNHPASIAAQPAMLSINAAMQVDLSAQANASFVRGRIFSGFGGQPDFVAGALHSPGGQAIIVLPSWHRGTAASTIVARLDPPVTSFQHTEVVTEHGSARIFGRTQYEQAGALIEEAADPRARDELWDAARQLSLA